LLGIALLLDLYFLKGKYLDCLMVEHSDLNSGLRLVEQSVINLEQG
jgi:hypothetical protein